MDSLIPADDGAIWDGASCVQYTCLSLLIDWVVMSHLIFSLLLLFYYTHVELNHQQSREIQQHLVDTQQTSFLQQTVESLRTATDKITSSFRYTPIDASPNLTDFGIPNDDPLLQGLAEEGYEEFPRRQREPTSFVFLEQFRLPQQDAEWGAVSNLDLFFSVRIVVSIVWRSVCHVSSLSHSSLVLDYWLYYDQQSLYNFYYHRGLTPILGKGIVDLFSLFVTLWLSVILFAYVDWQELAKCTDETTCKDSFGEYMKHRVSVVVWCLSLVPRSTH